MCKEALNPQNNRALLAAFRNFFSETGIGHSEIAHELGISPGALLGWLHGTVELRSATLVVIKSFLETHRPAHLRATQQDYQAERAQNRWHPFPQYRDNL
jgi:hypothetical protein